MTSQVQPRRAASQRAGRRAAACRRAGHRRAGPFKLARAHLLLAVGQHVAQLARQLFAPVRLAKQFYSRIEPPFVHDDVLRIAGSKQYGDVGLQLARLARHLRAADGAGHDHVRKEQVDLRAAVQHGQRAFAILGLEHRIAERAQHVDHGRAHAHVVFHHQHGFRAARDDAAQFHFLVRFGHQGTGQIDFDSRAHARFTVDADMAAALRDEAVGHRQAQARARPFRLGGEEGFERPLQHGAAHAVARIGDGQHHVLAGRHVDQVVHIVFIEHDIAQLDGQLARAIHGVARIDGQVQDDVFDLAAVDQGVPQPAPAHVHDVDGFAQGAPQQRIHIAHHAGQVGHHGFERLAPRKRQQVRRQLGAPLDGGNGRVEPLAHEAIRARQVLQQMQIAGNNLQHIVEVMRDTARQLAHGFHLLRLAQGVFGLGALAHFLFDPVLERFVQFMQRFFHAAPVRDVRLDGDQGTRVSLFIDEAADIARHPHLRTIGFQVAFFQ